MKKLFFAFLASLPFRIKSRFLLMGISSLLNTFLDLAVIFLLIPFIGSLTNIPNSVDSQIIIFLGSSIGSLSVQYNLGIYLILFAIVSGIVKYLSVLLINRTSATCGSYLATTSFSNILSQDLNYHNDSNKSELQALIIAQSSLATGVIRHFINLFFFSLYTILMISTLLFSEFIPTITSFTIFVSAYYLIARKSQPAYKRINSSILPYTSSQFEYIINGLSSARDVILRKTSNFYVNKFSSVDYSLRRLQADSEVLSASPKIVLEATSIAIIVVISLILISFHPSSNIFNQIALLVLILQKILPACQQIYTAYVGIKINVDPVLSFLGLVSLAPSPIFSDRSSLVLDANEKIKKITLSDICYLPSGSKKTILNTVNLEIVAGRPIAIVGKSGSGKSTLLDIISGLVKASSGGIRINDSYNLQELKSSDIFNYHKNIAYLSQDVFFFSGSIRDNIVFDSDPSTFQTATLTNVCNIAELNDLVDSFPQRLDHYIGDNGNLISGGQRQRIGLARIALRDCSVYILDESTSSLDSQTERKILINFLKYFSDRIIIVITHRDTCLDLFDSVYAIENGKLSII